MSFVFFFNGTATTEIYTLSLHDALPILYAAARAQLVTEVVAPLLSRGAVVVLDRFVDSSLAYQAGDRKSTRLNSSHRTISYAVFCLKKKNNKFNTKYVH